MGASVHYHFAPASHCEALTPPSAAAPVGELEFLAADHAEPYIPAGRQAKKKKIYVLRFLRGSLSLRVCVCVCLDSVPVLQAAICAVARVCDMAMEKPRPRSSQVPRSTSLPRGTDT